MNSLNEMWSHVGIKCPNCGGNDTEINLNEVFTSIPIQFKYRCKCGHQWYASEYDPTINYQDILSPQKIASGSYGWICPACGAGVSPYQNYCPCCSGKKFTPTWTCGTGTCETNSLEYRGEFNSEIKGEKKDSGSK